jgi:hypothetical protein
MEAAKWHALLAGVAQLRATANQASVLKNPSPFKSRITNQVRVLFYELAATTTLYKRVMKIDGQTFSPNVQDTEPVFVNV